MNHHFHSLFFDHPHHHSVHTSSTPPVDAPPILYSHFEMRVSRVDRKIDRQLLPAICCIVSTMTGSTRVFVCPLSYKSILLRIWVAMLYKRYVLLVTIYYYYFLSLSQRRRRPYSSFWIDLRQLWLCSNVRPHENISLACRPECLYVRMSPSLWVMSMERQASGAGVCVGSHVIAPKWRA